MAPITGVWIILGAGLVFYLRSRSPDLVRRLGQVMGEEGSGEAEGGMA